jgi:hypothetical protein
MFVSSHKVFGGMVSCRRSALALLLPSFLLSGLWIAALQAQELERRQTMQFSYDLAVYLEVHPSAQGVWATLYFPNLSDRPAALLKWIACFEGPIQNNVFIIDSELGSVPYTGRMTKRRPPTSKDFVIVAPGGKLSYRVNLATAYGFPPGKHHYRVRYFAFNPGLNDPKIHQLQSNEVEFDASM